MDNNFITEVKIVNEISYTVPDIKKRLNYIPLVIIAFMGISGMFFSFFSMFKTSVDTGTVAFLSILFFCIFSALIILVKKYYIVLIPIISVYCILLYRKFDEFVLGFKQIFNEVYENIYPYADSYFNVDKKSENYIDIFLAFFIFFWVLVVCFSVYIEPNFLLGFIFTFSVVETGIYFGKSPKIIYMFMLIIYWISLIVLEYCGRNQRKNKKSSGFIRNDNTFVARPGIQFSTAGLSVTIITLCCCVIFAFTALLSAISGYKRSDEINNLRSDVKFAASEFSFDNFGESLKNLTASFGFDKFKVYTHKLGTVGAINFKNTNELTIKVDTPINENVYLKGYTGAVYTGDEWVDFPDEVYEKNKRLFKSFERNESYPQEMLSDYFFERYDLYYSFMHIFPEYKNEKYHYIPYVSYPVGMNNGGTYYENDTRIYLDNDEFYSFQVNKIQVNDSNLRDILSGLDYSINDEFDEYNDFVYDNYLTVDYNEELQEVYDTYVKGTILEEDGDMYDKLIYIQELLRNEASYTLSPGRTPWGKDFVNYFLMENHKGYCMHFATAGIMLARMSGIPARYCDGYVINATDFNDKNRTLKDYSDMGDGYEIKIQDNRAHAWAEIYIENLGWIPFEFTTAGPALGIEEPTENTTEAITTNKSKKTTKSTTSVSKASISKRTTDMSVVIAVENKSNSSDKPIELSIEAEIILITLSMLAAACLIIILRHIWAKNKKEKNLHSGNYSEIIHHAYNYIIRILKSCGVDRGNMQYLEFSEYAKNKLPDIIDNDFEKVTQIMLKAQFSENIITDDEAELITAYYEKTFEKVYEKSNIIKKLDMRFVKNL